MGSDENYTRRIAEAMAELLEMRQRVFCRRIELLTARIWRNLAGAPISESAKQEIVQSAIEDTEHARPFNGATEESPSKPKEDEPIVRGEKLEVLRKKARAWAGWEPWLSDGK